MTTHLYATAADIPPELYDLILYFMKSGGYGEQYQGEQAERNSVSVDNRELGQLALVCWSWAMMCQKKIFAAIRLWSLGDFRALLLLASHPCSRISRYVEELYLFANSSSTPWIHTICLSVRPRSTSPEREGYPFPNYKGHTLVISHFDVLKHGVHSGLPRHVPGIFSQSILGVYLYDMELPGIREVVRLSRELPSLESLSFMEVTWAATPSTEEEAYRTLLRRCPRRRRVSSRVVTVECAAGWVALPLLCLLDTVRPLCASDLATVAKMARTLTMSVDQAIFPTLLTAAMRKVSGYAFGLCVAEDRLITPALWDASVYDATLGYWRVDVIALDFLTEKGATMRPLAEMVGYDWEGLATHAASLPVLRHVIVALKDREELAFFVKEIEPKLAQLRLPESPCIKYALRSNHYYKDGKLIAEPGVVACKLDDTDKDLASARPISDDDILKLYS